MVQAAGNSSSVTNGAWARRLVKDGAALYSREPWRLVIGVVGFVLICAGLWVATARHRRRLDASLASVAVPDDID